MNLDKSIVNQFLESHQGTEPIGQWSRSTCEKAKLDLLPDPKHLIIWINQYACGHSKTPNSQKIRLALLGFLYHSYPCYYFY